MPARVWFAMDAMFTHDPAIQRLGMEFGPAGPLTIAHLLGVAKLHDQGGAFEVHLRALAQAVYVDDVGLVEAIVTEAAQVGLLDVTEMSRSQRDMSRAQLLVANFPGWSHWQPERVLARERQQRHRAKSHTESGDSPDGNASVTEMSRSQRDKNVTTVTGTDTETVEAKASTTTGEHPDFAAWLSHHNGITGQTTPREQTAHRAEVAAMYSARRAEEYTAEDLCLATVGAYNDEYRREKGHYGCVSVLRPKKVHDLIERGRRGRPVAAVRDNSAEGRRLERQRRRMAIANGDEAAA